MRDIVIEIYNSKDDDKGIKKVGEDEGYKEVYVRLEIWLFGKCWRKEERRWVMRNKWKVEENKYGGIGLYGTSASL